MAIKPKKNLITNLLRTVAPKSFCRLHVQELNAQSDNYSATRAVCYLASFIIEHNLRVSVADHAGPLFSKMFSKSEKAKKYGRGRTKTTAIISEMAGQADGTAAGSYTGGPGPQRGGNYSQPSATPSFHPYRRM